MPLVYIIILNYKKWQDTQECMESLLHSTCQDFVAIIIDNDSKNDSLQKLSEYLLTKGIPDFSFLQIDGSISSINFSKFTFIQNKINAGFAGGINPVLQLLESKDAFVWLLNPDMVIEKNALRELIQFATAHSAESIIGAKIRAYKGNHPLLFYGGGMINFQTGTIRLCNRVNDIPKLDFISGGSLFTHVINFKKLGLLPEKYFLYWEDTDWTYSAKQRGYKLQVCANAICYDKVSSIIGKSFLADYYYAKNGLLFIKNHKKKNISKVLFFMSFRFLKRIISGKWKRAKGIWKGTMDYLKLQHNEGK